MSSASHTALLLGIAEDIKALDARRREQLALRDAVAAEAFSVKVGDTYNLARRGPFQVTRLDFDLTTWTRRPCLVGIIYGKKLKKNGQLGGAETWVDAHSMPLDQTSPEALSPTST